MYNLPLICRTRIKSTYLGNAFYEGDDNWGTYFYILVDREDLNPPISELLRKHPQYVVEFDHEDGVFFVLNINERQSKGIVTPFMSGKYSQIDRDYVNEYFPKRMLSGGVSSN